MAHGPTASPSGRAVAGLPASYSLSVSGKGPGTLFWRFGEHRRSPNQLEVKHTHNHHLLVIVARARLSRPAVTPEFDDEELHVNFCPRAKGQGPPGGYKRKAGTPGCRSEICYPFLKGGRCRFGDQCERVHVPNLTARRDVPSISFTKA